MDELLMNIANDISEFLETTKKFFCNEKELQVCLANYLSLRSDNYENVYLEYHIPVEDSQIPYPWNEKTISIDIVVENNNCFVPIEIKYKTRSLSYLASISRFGENFKVETVIKNQNAQDIGRYSFWKDVKRLELLKKRFKDRIIGGIALFVTNDLSYTTYPQSTAHLVGYYDFRMIPTKHEDKITGELCWRNRNGEQDHEWKEGALRNFDLEGEYKLENWRQFLASVGEESINMYYTYVIA